MLKLARKPSSDPIQEKLRQSKADLNKKISSFVNDLIHFKKLMNGYPNKFHMEKSRIIDPIPSDPATIIGSLISDFNEITQNSNVVIKQQEEYSKNRKKKQPKPPIGSAKPADLSNQLSLPLVAFIEEKYSLITEASNPFTRFFTKLLNPTFGLSEAARIRKYRMTLLDATVNAYKYLGKLQVEIVRSSKNSLPNANKILHKTWTDWMMVYRGFSTYKSNMPKEVKDAGGEISVSEVKDKKEPTTKIQEEAQQEEKPSERNDFEAIAIAKAIIQDYKSVISKNKFPDDASIFNDLNNVYTQFSMSQSDKKLNYANAIIEIYKNILNILNLKYNTSGATLMQIAVARDAKKTSLETVSQDFLRKWIGKTRHELSVFDKTSVFRLDIYKMAGEIRKTLNQIMDSLEKDMNIDELDPLIIEVNSKISALRGLMRALHNAEPQPLKSSKTPDNKNIGMTERMNMLESFI